MSWPRRRTPLEVQAPKSIPALGAADPSVLVNFDDLPARAISYRFQLSALIFGVLLRRADANVECNPLHDDLPAEITCAIGLYRNQLFFV